MLINIRFDKGQYKMNIGLKILVLFVGLVIINFSTYIRFYVLGNWSDRAKKTALIAGNVFIFLAWFGVMIFY